ncbi:MIP/aquaporin family protein [Holzapfeliella floricola]|uniref:Glycerol uptake facilitator related permease (Major Intrinsic protein family) n=1 Tax=Holzapfeliella floricola DSM 23037 = JCM 16512 TaxID=1423744 RepID=A0A0R2DKR6_9LACO|nr:MIP/aquaporin family protein [Holzapfeliella floricola]KRN04670.1 glycerol uptake facilitator related permease (major Intrinsic protein family) [Holzapfeliella floricola DSM 23037 = JCM 16512]
MEYSLWTQIIAEVIGTAFMVALGNGAVANVELKGTNGHKGSWFLIAWGFGIGVMIPALMFKSVSGAIINPAMVIGEFVNGITPLDKAFYFIVAQFVGAIIGQLLVVGLYLPYLRKTTSADAIYGIFSTREKTESKLSGFISEFVGSFVLFFAALTMANHAKMTQSSTAFVAIGLGFLVAALVTSLGGTTGPGLNPARDLGPRILHAILPLKNKGTSRWDYAWVPVVAPTVAAILAVYLFHLIF